MSESPSYHFSPLLSSSKALVNKSKEEETAVTERLKSTRREWKIELVHAESDQTSFYKSSYVHLDPEIIKFYTAIPEPHVPQTFAILIFCRSKIIPMLVLKMLLSDQYIKSIAWPEQVL